MINLSNRLLMCASLVPKSELVADIGADHGYLIAYLINNNIAKKGFAVENKLGPFNILKRNIIDFNLHDLIECSLSDGISKLPSSCKTVCIFGMGGETINYILSSSLEKLNNIDNFVISCHGESLLVHNFLINNGFGLIKQDACYDANKYYDVCLYQKGVVGRNYNDILIESKNQYFKEYLINQKRINEFLLSKDLPQNKINDLNKINQEIDELIKKL